MCVQSIIYIYIYAHNLVSRLIRIYLCATRCGGVENKFKKCKIYIVCVAPVGYYIYVCNVYLIFSSSPL